MIQRLLLVYNADEGLASMLIDGAHKILKPETYQCSLCMVSYGPVSMRRIWRKYLDTLPMEKAFYHRQDFARAYPVSDFPIIEKLTLPAILLEQEQDIHILLSDQQLDQIKNVDALIAATKSEIEKLSIGATV